MSDFQEYERLKEEQKNKAAIENSNRSAPFTTPGPADRPRHSKNTPARSSTPEFNQTRY